MKVSKWIVLQGNQAIRVLEGTLPINPVDADFSGHRVAVVARKAQVQIGSGWVQGALDPGSTCDIFGWLPEGNMMGFHRASRAWCDEQLRKQGYVLPDEMPCSDGVRVGTLWVPELIPGPLEVRFDNRVLQVQPEGQEASRFVVGEDLDLACRSLSRHAREENMWSVLLVLGWNMLVLGDHVKGRLIDLEDEVSPACKYLRHAYLVEHLERRLVRLQDFMGNFAD